MKFWSFILSLAFLMSLSCHAQAQEKGPLRYWNTVLDCYEQLCNSCLEHHSQKEIKSRTASLREMLSSPIGQMNEEQQKRFSDIQKRYHGITTEVEPAVSPAIHMVQVDTVRRVEHLTVVDTVFVREILGEVAILQQMSRRDTVVHILKQENAEVQVTVHDTIYVEPAPKAKKDRAPIFILALIEVTPELSYGAMAAYGDKFGAYIKARDNFHHRQSSIIYRNGDTVWATGNTDYSRTSVTVGGFMSILPGLKFYAGTGYGSYCLMWEDVEGRWMEVDEASAKGISFDAGLIYKYRNLALSLGADMTVPGYTDLELGIGICF